MKKLWIVLVGLMVSLAAWAQQYIDVVHLKNGGMVKGTIIEQVPGVSLKVQTADGSVFVFQMSEVEKMTKEKSQKAFGNSWRESSYNKLVYKNNKLFVHDVEISDEGAQEMMGVDLWQKYNKANTAAQVWDVLGWTSLGISLVFNVIWVGSLVGDNTNDHMVRVGVIGSLSFVLVSLICGGINISKEADASIIIKEYNENLPYSFMHYSENKPVLALEPQKQIPSLLPSYTPLFRVTIPF